MKAFLMACVSRGCMGAATHEMFGQYFPSERIERKFQHFVTGTKTWPDLNTKSANQY